MFWSSKSCLLPPHGDTPARDGTSPPPKIPDGTSPDPATPVSNLIKTSVWISWKTKKTSSGKLLINALKLHKDLTKAMIKQDPTAYYLPQDGHTKIRANNYPTTEDAFNKAFPTTPFLKTLSNGNPCLAFCHQIVSTNDFNLLKQMLMPFLQQEDMRIHKNLTPSYTIQRWILDGSRTFITMLSIGKITKLLTNQLVPIDSIEDVNFLIKLVKQ